MFKLKHVLAALWLLAICAPALAQAPATTKPSAVNMLTANCSSGSLLTGGATTPGCLGLGSGVSAWLAAPSGANLLAALTTSTGTGVPVFGTSPTIASPTFTGTVAGPGTIPNAVLVNSSLTVNGTAISLGGSGTVTVPIATGVTGLGTGVATALGVAVGSAGSPVINGGALGSPSSAGTIPAFTLGGAISGGGNNINNVNIGAVSPGTGAFTTLTASISATNPLHIGGTGTTSTLTLRSTSGVGTTGADIIFQGGNNGATEIARMFNGGGMSIGTASSLGDMLNIQGAANSGIGIYNNGGQQQGAFRWNGSAGGYFFLTDPGLTTEIEFLASGGSFHHGSLTLGSGTAAVANAGELAFAKIPASGTAPGAGYLKIAAVAGTNTGTCKIIAYAGTSTTPVTLIDNVGSGC